MGNFEKVIGYKFKEKMYFFFIYSDVKEKFVLVKFMFLILWVFVFLICYGVSVFKYFWEKNICGMFLFDLVVLLIGFGFVVILVMIVGDGEVDLMKYNFLFNVCFDLMMLIGVVFLLEVYMKKRGEWNV